MVKCIPLKEQNIKKETPPKQKTESARGLASEFVHFVQTWKERAFVVKAKEIQYVFEFSIEFFEEKEREKVC
jgi:hypothetical protein